MKYLKRDIKKIFLLLGTGCNLNCKYCFQHSLSKTNDLMSINPDVFDFIKEQVNSSSCKTAITFYGGEPLVYFDVMKEVVKNLKDLDNFYYTIISNGKLLNKEIVNFINKYIPSPSISWDGVDSINTRLYDVVKDKQNELLLIKNLTLAGVISKEVSPLNLIKSVRNFNSIYRDKNGYSLRFIAEEIVDMEIGDKTLLNIDYDLYEKEMTILCDISKEMILGHLPPDDIILSYIGYLVGQCKESKKSILNCGNGYNVFNLDMQGNLYGCHNSYDMVGNIYDNYWDYLDNVSSKDNTRNLHKECIDCNVYVACHGGCPKIPDKVRKESYCKLKKAIFLPVIKFIEDVNTKGANLLCQQNL